MEEQSHKNDMRAALRGDFERLRARREGSSEPGEAPRTAPEPTAELQPATVASARGSWLDRLRDRR